MASVTDPGLSFETWTFPSAGSFVRKKPISRYVAGFTLNDRFSDYSDGAMQVDSSFPWADETLYLDEDDHNNDKGSVLRVLRGTTPVAHFVIHDMAIPIDVKAPYMDLALVGAEWFLDRLQVPHYDHPAQPTKNPQWIFGAESIIDEVAGEIAKEVQTIHRDAAVNSGTFTITFGAETTAALDWDASSGEVGTALEALTNIVLVDVEGTGSQFSPWAITFIDPSGDVAQVTIGSSTLNGNLYITTLTTGGTTSPRPWTPSFHPVTGLQHGGLNEFAIVTTPVNPNTGATISLEIDGIAPQYPGDYAGGQILARVNDGGEYRAALWVRSATTQAVRFVIRDMSETYIASVEMTLAANSWTLMDIPFFVVPDGVDQLIYRVAAVVPGTPGVLYVDIQNALLAPGKPASLLGDIFNQICQSLIDNYSALGWITRTWTTTHDSAGALWDENRSWLIDNGQTLLQLIEHAKQWGYRYRFHWVEANTRWEWDLWNPEGGTTTAAGVGLLVRGGVVETGKISRRVPQMTYALADGREGVWGAFSNSPLEATWGFLMGYSRQDQALDAVGLAELAETQIEDSLQVTDGVVVNTQNPEYLPWVHYTKGQNVQIDLGPNRPNKQMLVVSVVATKEAKGAIKYATHCGAIVHTGQSALVDSVLDLKRARKAAMFERRPEGAVDGATFTSKGGMASVLIAASNATSYSKRKADFECSGIDDHVLIQGVIDKIQFDGFEGGTVWLTEGTYFCTSRIELGSINLRGIGGMEEDSGPFLDFVVTDGTTTAIDMSSGSSLQNLHVRWETEDTTLTKIVTSGSGPGYIDHVQFEAFGSSEPWASTGTVIHLGAGNEHWVTNVLMECECPLGIVTNGGNSKYIDNVTIKFAYEYGIKHSSGSEFHVSNVYLENCGTLDDLTTGGIFCFGGELLALNNIQMTGQRGIGLFVSTGYSIVGTGLHIELSGEIAYGIGVSGMPSTTSLAISGLAVLQGSKQINIEDSAGLISITGFVLRATREDGIVITDSSKVQIADGQIGSVSVVDDDTHDAIRIEGDSNRNYISGVMIRPKTTANQWRYGINIADATCDENILRDIILDDAASYATDDVNDAGTGTILTNNVSF